MCLPYKSFENNVGKGEVARNEFRLLFSAYYSLSPLQKHVRNVVGGFGEKVVIVKV